MKIAVCDDNFIVCNEIESFILSYSQKTSVEISIEIYYSGERLISDLEDSKYFDLIFLDIELRNKKMSGIDTGTFIRDNLALYAIEIVFISSFSQYAIELFRVQPMDFIIKPFGQDKIFSVLDQYIKQERVISKKFVYKVGREEEKVLIKDIIFFRSDLREMELYLVNGICKKFYSSMKDVSAQLKQLKGQFFMTHKSYIVNYYHVLEFHSDYLLLSEKHIAPISKKKEKNFTLYRKNLKMKGKRHGLYDIICVC